MTFWQFLPARKVMEKAHKLRSTITKEMLSGTTSTNILAMTFRQVTLQHLWNFELVLFIPGAERNMDDLETPREVGNFFIVSIFYLVFPFIMLFYNIRFIMFALQVLRDTDRLSSVIPFLSAGTSIFCHHVIRRTSHFCYCRSYLSFCSRKH